MAATQVKRRRRRQRSERQDAPMWAIGAMVSLAFGLVTLVLAALFWDKSVRHGDIASVGADVEIPVTLFSVLTFGLGIGGVLLGSLFSLVALIRGREWQRWAGAAVLIIVWACVMWTRHDGRLPYGMTYSSCDGFFHSSNERKAPPAFECKQNASSSSAKWRPMLPYLRAYDPKNTSVEFLSPSAAVIHSRQNVRDGLPLMEFALVLHGPSDWHNRKVQQASPKAIREGVYRFEFQFDAVSVPVEYDSARHSLNVLGRQTDLGENWIAVVQLDDTLKSVATTQVVAAPRFATAGKDAALALVNGARLDRMVIIGPCWPAQWVCEAAPAEAPAAPAGAPGDQDKSKPAETTNPKT